MFVKNSGSHHKLIFHIWIKKDNKTAKHNIVKQNSKTKLVGHAQKKECDFTQHYQR